MLGSQQLIYHVKPHICLYLRALHSLLSPPIYLFPKYLPSIMQQTGKGNSLLHSYSSSYAVTLTTPWVPAEVWINLEWVEFKIKQVQLFRKNRASENWALLTSVKGCESETHFLWSGREDINYSCQWLLISKWNVMMTHWDDGENTGINIWKS